MEAGVAAFADRVDGYGALFTYVARPGPTSSVSTGWGYGRFAQQANGADRAIGAVRYSG